MVCRTWLRSLVFFVNPLREDEKIQYTFHTFKQGFLTYAEIQLLSCYNPVAGVPQRGVSVPFLDEDVKIWFRQQFFD